MGYHQDEPQKQGYKFSLLNSDIDGMTPSMMLAVRIFNCTFSLIALSVAWYRDVYRVSFGLFISYLTNWALLLSVTTLTLLVIATIKETKLQNIIRTTLDDQEALKAEKNRQKLVKFTFMMYEIGISSELVVSAIFWGIIYPIKPSEVTTSLDIVYSSLCHGMLFVVFLGEMIIHRYEFQRENYRKILMMACAYSVFNCVVVETTGFSPYTREWDGWNSWKTAVFIVTGFLGGISAYFLLASVEEVKNKFVARLCGAGQEDNLNQALLQDKTIQV